MDKVQKIREEVARIQAYTQSDVLKEVLDYIDKVQEETKFKTGDHIKPIDSSLGAPRTILEVCDGWYVTNQGTLDFEFEDNWELVAKNTTIRPKYCLMSNSLYCPYYNKQQHAWSKEDEERYISCLQRLGTGDPKQPETINSKWFKEHVYPQSTWKPSDEQMEALNEVLNFAANHESPHWNDYIFGTLNNLIRQLKKLREESL